MKRDISVLGIDIAKRVFMRWEQMRRARPLSRLSNRALIYSELTP
jgi:hypothetical protein